MIDSSVVKRLAIQCGFHEMYQNEFLTCSKGGLQAFAQAAIEDYKASLVPVAWYDKKLGVFDEKQFDNLEPLYTLPHGESK